ncbi:MAG: endonuclease III [Holosporaceae bacterium]|jgi:endonuclease-3|nr:endonuclease III [Holosporaceae bacterium]
MSRVEEICRRLEASINEPKSELNYASDYTFLVAVVLSAQTTDVQVNKVTSRLFEKCKTADDVLNMGLERLTDEIRSIGLYRNKAKNIIELSKILKLKFNSKVPDTREDLESLPGVGRKTANVVLNALFGKSTIAVDTHVLRLSKILEFSRANDPLKVEKDLEKLIPSAYKKNISNLLVLHGRYVCKAQKPKCRDCVLFDLCNGATKNMIQ